jgi:hypothetical protein
VKKIFLAIIFLIAIVVFFLFYPVIKDRVFKSETKKIEIKPQNEKINNDETSNVNNPVQEGQVSENNQPSISAPNITVNSSDCDNECSRFKKDDEVNYCEQVCGISDLYEQDYESENSDTLDCEKQSGIQKDYCLKDKAIQAKDFNICTQIKDQAVKKTCQNRITEDIISTQNNID